MIAKVIPLHREETDGDRLFIGIDVGKAGHVAAFLSAHLLEKHRRYEKCPTMPFSNARTGFESLVTAMRSYASPERCTVLLERTGHYHKALAEYLQAQGIAVYDVHVSQEKRRIKNDKRDALALANTLYNQVGLGIQVEEKSQQVHRFTAPSQTAQRLRGLSRHRYELSREITQRCNKLTGICDQLFPELTEIFKDPNAVTALGYREAFPTPADLAAASFDELKAHRRAYHPGKAALLRLQELAGQSIGITDAAQIEALLFEQGQLIAELRLLQANLQALDAKMTPMVEGSREGRILLSTGMIRPSQAAAIIAGIGTIANFESAAKLKAYCGWSPTQRQTGTSFDAMKLTEGGNRVMRHTLYMIGWTAIKDDTEWKALYERLVPVKCQWDARLGRYKGKNKVLGRVIGQIITLIWYLLKKDDDLLQGLRPGEEVPEPTLYSRDIHRGHRHRGT